MRAGGIPARGLLRCAVCDEGCSEEGRRFGGSDRGARATGASRKDAVPEIGVCCGEARKSIRRWINTEI